MFQVNHLRGFNKKRSINFAAYTTWNPLDTAGSGGVTLSNGNLTITTPNDAQYKDVRTVRKNLGTGKYYWEIKVNTVGGSGATLLGIRSGADTLTGGNWSLYGTFALWRSNGGYWVRGGPTVGVNAASFTSNDVCMFALDLTNDRMWVGKNGTWNNSGNPVANTNASFTTLPAATEWGVVFHADNSTGTEVVTANFGATAFSYSVPSGFTAGIPPS